MSRYLRFLLVWQSICSKEEFCLVVVTLLPNFKVLGFLHFWAWELWQNFHKATPVQSVQWFVGMSVFVCLGNLWTQWLFWNPEEGAWKTPYKDLENLLPGVSAECSSNAGSQKGITHDFLLSGKGHLCNQDAVTSTSCWVTKQVMPASPWQRLPGGIKPKHLLEKPEIKKGRAP